MEKNNKPPFLIEEGVLKKYNGPGGEVSVPAGVTAIGPKAFMECDRLTGVTLPEGVTSVGEQAFMYCQNLRSINFPEGLTEIDACAFLDCRALTGLVFPESLWYIGALAFTSCRGLTEIRLLAGMTVLQMKAFMSCENLERVTLPAGLIEIAESLFEDCFHLKEISIPAGVTVIRRKAFYFCTSLEKVRLPESLTVIETRAFSQCEQLAEISFPARLARVGANAFYFSNKLVLPKWIHEMSNAPAYEFAADDETAVGYFGWAEVVRVPKCVTAIGENCFNNTRARKCVKKVILHDGVTSIGKNAFASCHLLEEVVIPDSVTRIGTTTFRDCTGLTEITFPDCLTEIKDRAFCGCKGITEVKFGRSSLKTVGEEAFRGCAGLPAITLPGSVESLGANAFGWCGALRSVTLTDCEGIPYAFSGCRSLWEFIIPPESARYSSVDGVLLTRDGKTLILYPPGRKCRRYDIPGSVEEVAANAFVGAPVELIYAHEGVVRFAKYAAHEMEDSAPYVAYHHADYTLRLGKPVYLGPPDDLSRKQKRRVKKGYAYALSSRLPEFEPWKDLWYENFY